MDEPDFPNISQCNIDRLVFDENNHERPPFSLSFYCGENIKLDRSLLVILIHLLVILILVIFCMTKLAPITVSQKDFPYLVSLCNTVPPQRPKFKVGDRIRIRRKIETFHRGYRIQFTEELFTISHIPTNNPPTYVVKDVNDEIIQGKFYEPELVKFVCTTSTTAT